MTRMETPQVVRLMGACLSAVILTGCGRPTESVQTKNEVKAQPASFRQLSPDVFLGQVFARYRTATSYQDRAVASLAYTSGGKTETKSAPLNVWFDQDQLYVQAYDVQIFSDSKGMMAWIGDQQPNNFDAQVLRTASTTRRPTTEWLFDDPILRNQVAAGLAGPPPQLEWLFSKEPMKALFQRDHRFTFEQPRMVGNRRCRVVQVEADREMYRFWVDDEFGLIRRIDFPSMMAPAVAGRPPQRITLMLDLVGASFDGSKQTPDIKPLPNEPMYVSRFVPLPPVAPPKNVGNRPAAFREQTSDGQITVTERGSDRDATIAVRYAGDEQSIAAVATLQHWHAQMPESLLRKVRLVVLAKPPLADQLAQVSLPVIIDRDDTVAKALNLAPGALAIQDKSGRIAWVQSDLSHASIISLGAIVADIGQGIDVPSRVRGQWKEQTDAYQEALRKVSVVP